MSARAKFSYDSVTAETLAWDAQVGGNPSGSRDAGTYRTITELAPMREGTKEGGDKGGGVGGGGKGAGGWEMRGVGRWG